MLELLLDTRIPFVVNGKAIDVRLLVGDVSALMADDALQTEALTQLSPFRREKALAIKHPRGRAQSIGASLLLDALLAEQGLHERDMNYVVGEHGKPELEVKSEQFTLPFNLSHSGSMAAAAVIESRDERLEIKDSQAQPSLISHLSSLILGCSLGLDIQRITRYRPELVRRVFSAADRQLLAAAPDESSRERLFAQRWCRAEAYAKATGLGLQWPFPTPPATALFHDFEVGNDYCGSLCLINNFGSIGFSVN